MQAEHPGEEEETIMNDRVLGAIAVTRGTVHLLQEFTGAYGSLHQLSVTTNSNYLLYTLNVS